MNRGSRILLMGMASIMMYLVTVYILLQTPVVATFTGSDGVTTTEVFKVTGRYWDMRMTYFKEWSPFWSMRVEAYKEGEDAEPVFSTSITKYTYPSGEEKAELGSHPSLPSGRYYLKIYSENVQWTVQIVEWD